MIAVSFLLRVMKFLIAFVIIVGGLAVVWYGMLYLVKRALDVVEDANSGFAGWLATKFPFSVIVTRRRRKRGMERDLASALREIRLMDSQLRDDKISTEVYIEWLKQFAQAARNVKKE